MSQKSNCNVQYAQELPRAWVAAAVWLPAIGLPLHTYGGLAVFGMLRLRTLFRDITQVTLAAKRDSTVFKF